MTEDDQDHQAAEQKTAPVRERDSSRPQNLNDELDEVISQAQDIDLR